jgi:hypothetical protein
MVVQTSETETDLITRKCVRCGGCCLASPCFFVKFGEEVFVTIENIKIHKCKNLSFKGSTASCNIYKKMNEHGFCSSTQKYKNQNVYKNLLERINNVWK